MARSNIQPHTETIDGRTFTVWGDSDKLNDYISGLTVDTAAAESFSTTSVASHTRKRYPGDPGYNVGGHNRTVSNDRGIDGSPATPGSRFWFERRIGLGDLAVKTQHQGTYQGSWRAFKAYCKANVTLPFTLRRESGRSFPITPPIVP
jgi:hypothetical protein